jgi:hypothetical protein
MMLAMRTILAVCVALVAVAGCSSSGGKRTALPSSFAYGSDPIAIAKALKICGEPTRFSTTIAECAFSDGNIGIASIANASAQSYAASVADSGSNACDLIGQGFTIQAPSTVLAAHVDVQLIESQYRAEQHGQC